ncbi:glycerate kinase isoform X2 [Mastacembelus armatus]|uniref:Glycerate kinase n=1 Tax=Mastacembelus armatus TaxID=205130 RepID=A0A3Q3SGB5_9TELE|nr:glycerate kinase isoform X2 [Mastacembelus armatus]XP_026162210.1 glycerate kinase isoform X2 [Mastacembelus armatus]XP_026162211.1 glycerate kinase isoform X2 [Mastacembelus armatus]
MARVLSLFWSQPFLPLAGRTKTTLCKMSMDSRARKVFAAALKAVQPHTVVQQNVERKDDAIIIDGHKFTLQHNLHLVGFGKAVLGMAAEVERIMGDHLVKGVISVPHGIQETLQQHGKHHLLLKENSCIKIIEGAKHNLPDTDAQKAAEEIMHLASELQEKDILLVLISGGGSALLPAPIPPITLQEKLDVTRKLAAAGATIQELNTVRRALSLLKGGGLAHYAHPAQVVALILSDVIGDPLDLIASGPTVQSEVWPEEVLSVLERYNLLHTVPVSVKDVLGRTSPRWKGNKDQTDKAEHVLNVVIGSNSVALMSAGRCVRELGFRPVVLSPGVCGNVRSVSRLYGLLAHFACSREEPPPEIATEVLRLGPEVGVESWDLCRTMQVLGEGRTEGWGATCMLAGGEPTVKLTGKGRGGRNQELALRVGLELRGLDLPPSGPVFLSGGTDGQDGPTEAAGAITDGRLYEEAQAQGLDIDSFLINNDSYTFFSCLSAGKRLVVSGLTCTNVMDVHMLLIPPIPINIG